jgi:two-component system sensor histidine kinase QseC
MNSVRFRLFIILAAATSLVWLSAFVWVQQSTRGKVERVLDARLAEAGQMVSSLLSDQRIDLNTIAVAATGAAKTDGILETDYSHKLSCQIWSLNGALVGSSGSAPQGKLTDRDTGFSTNVIDGEKWRVYSVVNEALGMRIMVGDSYKVRDRLVEDVTRGLALPALLVLPIMAVLILVSVQRGLAPLERKNACLTTSK